MKIECLSVLFRSSISLNQSLKIEALIICHWCQLHVIWLLIADPQYTSRISWVIGIRIPHLHAYLIRNQESLSYVVHMKIMWDTIRKYSQVPLHTIFALYCTDLKVDRWALEVNKEPNLTFRWSMISRNWYNELRRVNRLVRSFQRTFKLLVLSNRYAVSVGLTKCSQFVKWSILEFGAKIEDSQKIIYETPTLDRTDYYLNCNDNRIVVRRITHRLRTFV